MSAYTEDISESGVRVTTREPLDIDSQNSLVVYITRQPIACKGEVKWIKKRQSRYIEDSVFFDIGMEFKDLRERDKLAIAERVDALSKQQQWSEKKKSNETI